VSIDDLYEVGALRHLPKSAPYMNPLTYLLNTYLLTYMGFSKNPLSDP